MTHGEPVVISLILAVPDAATAAAWYREALGLEALWDLGSVVGLRIAGAAVFLGEPSNNGWDHPARLGMPTVRVEVFCDDPDAFMRGAVAAGATSRTYPTRVYDMPWGPHRQGSFADPFGHLWFVGDRSSLQSHARAPISLGEGRA